MIPDFRYIRPKDLKEALEILEEGGVPIAGGTDLVVDMKEGKKRPSLLVDISHLEELRFINDSKENVVKLGPLLTHRDIINSKTLQIKALPLVLASAQIGSPQIRNVGTIGGNICNGSPAGDTLPALAVLEAEFLLQKRDDKRVVPFSQFFIGPYRTNLQKGELLVEIRFKGLEGWKGGFWKIGRRRAFVQARINLAIASFIEGTIIKKIRIALGSCTPFPLRIEEAERLLEGRSVEESFLNEAAIIARQKVERISGGRASAVYKLPVIEGLLKRSLIETMSG